MWTLGMTTVSWTELRRGVERFPALDVRAVEAEATRRSGKMPTPSPAKNGGVGVVARRARMPPPRATICPMMTARVHLEIVVIVGTVVGGGNLIRTLNASLKMTFR